MANWFTKFFSRRKDPVMLNNGMVMTPSGMILWGGTQYSPEYLLGLNVEQLQKKALQIWWESIHARGAVNQLNILTINTGARLQSLPARGVLGISIQESQEIASQIEAYFGLYRQQKRASHDGRFNFNELEIIGRKCYDVFGEVFGIIRYTDNGPTVQLINPLAVKSPAIRPVNGDVIDRGIRFRGNKPLGFYVESIKDGTTYFEYVPFVNTAGKRVGIHCADIQTPEQVRGMPRLAPVFHELKRILQGLKYELDSMATNATVAIVIQRDKPVTDANRIKEMFGAPRSEGLAPTRVDEIDQGKVTTASGGMVWQNLKEGEKPTTLDTSRPNINIPNFIDKEMEWIGPAIGIPATVWKMLFSSNYMASRGELELGWKSFEVEMYRFSTSFQQYFYEAVVGHMVAKGMIILSGWSDMWRRDAWLMAAWRGTPMPRLNPLQEEKAATERIRNFTSSREAESQKATGTSFENNMERQLYEMRYLEDLKRLYDDAGLEFDSINQGF